MVVYQCMGMLFIEKYRQGLGGMLCFGLAIKEYHLYWKLVCEFHFIFMSPMRKEKATTSSLANIPKVEDTRNRNAASGLD